MAAITRSGSILVDRNGEHPDGARQRLHRQGGHDMTAHAERFACHARVEGPSAEISRRLHALLPRPSPARCVRGRSTGRDRPRRVRSDRKGSQGSAHGAHEENPTLDLPCRVVFAAGQRKVDVIGPLLADEAAELQAGFWNDKSTKTIVSAESATMPRAISVPIDRNGALAFCFDAFS